MSRRSPRRRPAFEKWVPPTPGARLWLSERVQTRDQRCRALARPCKLATSALTRRRTGVQSDQSATRRSLNWRFARRLGTLDDGLARAHAKLMGNTIPVRQYSASAPFIRQPVRATPADRILRALELGRRGQLLRKMNPDARPKQETGAR